jgi:hypothetical protein
MNRDPRNNQYAEELEYQRAKVAQQYPALTRQNKVALLQIREEIMKAFADKSRAVLPLEPETNNEKLFLRQQLNNIMEALMLGKKTTEVQNILNERMMGGLRKKRQTRRRKTKGRKTRGRK